MRKSGTDEENVVNIAIWARISEVCKVERNLKIKDMGESEEDYERNGDVRRR